MVPALIRTAVAVLLLAFALLTFALALLVESFRWPSRAEKPATNVGTRS